MQEFLDLCRCMWEQKAKVDELKSQVKDANAELTKLQVDILKRMDVMELEKQHIKGYGTLFLKRERSVQVPKSIPDKLALFDWIKEHKGEDVLNKYLSINSQSLNSFWKQEYEIAKEEGNIDFAMAGVAPPEMYTKLGTRKG